MGAYNVSKHAVVALSETLFHDLNAVGGEGGRIGCSVLCPAFVPTGISDSERNRPAALREDKARSEIDQQREAFERLDRCTDLIPHATPARPRAVHLHGQCAMDVMVPDLSRTDQTGGQRPIAGSVELAAIARGNTQGERRCHIGERTR